MNDYKDPFIRAQIVYKKNKRINREALAEESYKKKRAKNKGRNHIKNWERRLIEKEKKRLRLKLITKTNELYRQYKNEINSYWKGLRDDLPKNPKE